LEGNKKKTSSKESPKRKKKNLRGAKKRKRRDSLWNGKIKRRSVPIGGEGAKPFCTKGWGGVFPTRGGYKGEPGVGWHELQEEIVGGTRVQGKLAKC